MYIAFVSGGADSTAMLELLSQTDQEILVHNVHFTASYDRQVCEAIAMDYIKEHYGSRFTWETSSIDVSGSPSFRFSKDASWMAMIASMYLNEVDVEGFYFGFEKDAANDITDGWNTELYRKCQLALDVQGATDIKITSPISHLFKDECFALIPEELKTKVWSCRAPIIIKGNYTQCRACVACQDYARLGIPYISKLPAGEHE